MDLKKDKDKKKADERTFSVIHAIASFRLALIRDMRIIQTNQAGFKGLILPVHVLKYSSDVL